MYMDITLALQRTPQDSRKQIQIAVRVGIELGSPTLHPLGHAASYKHSFRNLAYMYSETQLIQTPMGHVMASILTRYPY